MFRYSLLTFVFLLLATVLVHAQAASDLRVVSDHPHHVILARALVLSDGDGDTHALTLAHRTDGVHWLRLDAAFAYGHALPFERLPPRTVCVAPGRCPARLIGVVLLPPALVASGRREGLTLRLHGNMGVMHIFLPPDLLSGVRPV